MTAQNITTTPAKPPRKKRISPAVRNAINIRVKEAVPWAEAAKRADMSEAGIHKARKQQHVQEYQKEVEAQYIQDVEAMRAPYKARAFEVAAHLMENAKSEATRARMVEFLAGESKGAGVSVAVQVNNHTQTGDYEYVRPGQTVVEIRSDRAAHDTASGEPAPESPTKQG